MSYATEVSRLEATAAKYEAINASLKPAGMLTSATAVEVVLYSKEFEVETTMPLLAKDGLHHLKGRYQPEDVAVFSEAALDAGFEDRVRDMVEAGLDTHEFRGIKVVPSFWADQAQKARDTAKIFSMM